MPAARPPYGYWEESQAVVSLVLSTLGLAVLAIIGSVAGAA